MIKRYPEYAERELALVGDIPMHWNTVRCAHLFEVKNITKTSGEINLSVYRDYGVIERDSRDDNHNRIPADTSNYKLVERGDFVFNKMKCWQGSLGVSEYRGIVSPAYTVCSPKKPFHGKYLHYLLRSRPYVQELRRLSYGVRIGQWELRFKDFKDVVVPYPSVLEQTQIANFLDRKSQQIDELIRAKERKIELLGEYRASVIHQAVTKGLDPNVEMKPSGLEWISEVPKDWEVLKVKHVSSSNPSKNNPKTKSFNDEPVVFLPMERVHTDGTIDQALKLPFSQLKTGYTYFEENDVLVAKVTPCFENGKIVLVKDLATPVGFGSTEFIVIRPNVKKVFPLFLYYLLYNYPLRSIGKHFMTSAVGLKRVPLEFIRNFQVPIPSYQEQIHIVDFLDRKITQIDEIRSSEEQTIKLLKEYRQSLISGVVTGKIDVRGEV